jgi:MarR family transcriptional regulator, lower aerobic nicotinate degradation pathway regulator
MLLMRVARAYGGRLARALDGFELRPQEFAVLHQLADGESLSQRGLGRSLRIHPSNLVAVLDRLHSAGLVTREADPTDRRRQLLAISAAGRSLLVEAEVAVAVVESDLFEPLSAAERARLEGILGRLAAHSCSVKGKGKRC